ncbi:MAG TPA: hypothetical protein VLD67_02145, partial [Vicinamibacterales bacterium]|nr:hypothetical protein [Vicinamibacterales bacterium]
MEFRDYAARETSALIERLLATWSEGALQQLRGLREAIDAATLAVVVPGDPATHAEGEIQELT